MIVNLDIKNLLYCLFDRLYPGITEFHNLPRVCQDHMIVLPVKIGFLILSLVFTELVFAHKFALQ